MERMKFKVRWFTDARPLDYGFLTIECKEITINCDMQSLEICNFFHFWSLLFDTSLYFKVLSRTVVFANVYVFSLLKESGV